jgi:hypothetical protein
MGKHPPRIIPPEERTYPVGYCKPDPAKGFQKGQVANPSGRPRKRTPSQQTLDFLESTVTAQDGTQMPLFVAIIRAMASKALKGDTKAAAFVVKLQREMSSAAPGDPVSNLTDEDRKLIEDFGRRLKGGEEEK